MNKDSSDKKLWSFIGECLEPLIREQVEYEVASKKMQLLGEEQLVQKRKADCLRELRGAVEDVRGKIERGFQLLVELLPSKTEERELETIYREMAEAGLRIRNRLIRRFDASSFEGGGGDIRRDPRLLS